MTAHAQGPSERDERYFAVRHGDLPYAWPGYPTLAEWEERATWLRRRLAVVLGLWPEPERCPLNVQIGGRIEYEDYTIETVCFESWPGFYCTGNLYRPRGITGRVPGVLHPHGHWQRGRLEHQPLGSIRARCITMARMGMVSFAYDMVGRNDSLQVPAHGVWSLRGSLWGLTSMALQTWNSMRGIDLLQSLPDVDPERIGCTGASGGGTQTFMVMALDPRIKVAAPVNMISSIMQGGCPCENAPGLRTQTYNVEIAALMAPRPLLMVSATGDWTVNTPLVEYPAVRSVYRLYGAEERLAEVQFDAPHNYHLDSRAAVYRWFARWLLGDEALGVDVECEFVVEPDERMRVFPAGQLPAGALNSVQVAHQMVERAERRLAALQPFDASGLERLRQETQTRLTETLEAAWPASEAVVAAEGQRAGGLLGDETELVLGRKGRAERVPGTLYLPASGEAPRYALLVHGAGRVALQDGYGQAGEMIAALRATGWGVLAMDAFYTGAVPADASPWRQDWFWLTFNPTLLGQRVQDVLTALAYLAGRAPSDGLALVGLGQAGLWGVFAAALCPLELRLCLDLDGTAGDDAAFLGEMYAPNLRAYGDLRAAGALLAPRPLILTGAQRWDTAWVERAYAAAGATDRLQICDALTPEILERLENAR